MQDPERYGDTIVQSLKNATCQSEWFLSFKRSNILRVMFEGNAYKAFNIAHAG